MNRRNIVREVKVAKSAGFCFGVKSAVEMV